MPSFDVDARQIHVFPIDDEYLFTQYFEEESLFTKLQDYYNGDEYRFEVPDEDFVEVATILEDYYYEPVVVEEVSEFGVVKDQYMEHTDILRNSVASWTRDGMRFFLLKDLASVAQAVEQGASRISDTDYVLGI